MQEWEVEQINALMRAAVVVVPLILAATLIFGL